MKVSTLVRNIVNNYWGFKVYRRFYKGVDIEFSVQEFAEIGARLVEDGNYNLAEYLMDSDFIGLRLLERELKVPLGDNLKIFVGPFNKEKSISAKNTFLYGIGVLISNLCGTRYIYFYPFVLNSHFPKDTRDYSVRLGRCVFREFNTFLLRSDSVDIISSDKSEVLDFILSNKFRLEKSLVKS